MQMILNFIATPLFRNSPQADFRYENLKVAAAFFIRRV